MLQRGPRAPPDLQGRRAATRDVGPRTALADGIRHRLELAERPAAIAPGGPTVRLDRVSSTGYGSASIDTALKIAVAYQRVIGQGTRTCLIGRERSYHAVGFGGISVDGLVNNRRSFPLLSGVDHPRPTHDVIRNACSKGLPKHGVDLADDLERLVALPGAETIAAVILESVAGSTSAPMLP